MENIVEKKNIDIELDAEIAEGNYANLVIIAHSQSEFVLDFAVIMPGLPKAKVKNRIILTPEHAKRLLLTLQDNITRYESNVGQIKLKPTLQEQDGDDGDEFGESTNSIPLSFNIGEA